MSQHPSLRVGGKIRKIRNVMKRYERLNVLRAEGRIAEDKVLGLPKPNRSKSDLSALGHSKNRAINTISRFFVAFFPGRRKQVCEIAKSMLY